MRPPRSRCRRRRWRRARGHTVAAAAAAAAFKRSHRRRCARARRVSASEGHSLCHWRPRCAPHSERGHSRRTGSQRGPPLESRRGAQ
eukprot:493465-Prymnesium_polylepis.1